MADLVLKIDNKEYDKAYITDVSCTMQTTTDASSVNYGVVPATGSASMWDIDGSIKKEIDAGELDYANATTRLKLNGKQLGLFSTDDSEYNIQDKRMDISFGDLLSTLDNVKYKGMPIASKEQTAYEMLDDVLGDLEKNYVRGAVYNWTVLNPLRLYNGNAFNRIIIDKQTQLTNCAIYTPVQVEKSVPTVIKIAIARSAIQFYTGLVYDKDVSYPVVEIWEENPNTNTIAGDIDGIAKPICWRYINSETDWDIEEDGETATEVYSLKFIPKTSVVYLTIRARNTSKNGYIGLPTTYDKKVHLYISPKIEVLVERDGVLKSAYSLAKRLEQEMCGDGGAKSNLYNKMMDIVIDYPYLASGSMREVLEQFCTLTQTSVALDENGQMRFYDARPVYKNEDVIKIPKSYQLNDFEKTLFLKNKVTTVTIDQEKPKIETKNDDDFYSFVLDIDKASDGTYSFFVDGVQVSPTDELVHQTITELKVDDLTVGYANFNYIDLSFSDIELWDYEEAKEALAINSDISISADGTRTSGKVGISNGGYYIYDAETIENENWTSWYGGSDKPDGLENITNYQHTKNVAYGVTANRVLDENNSSTLVSARDALNIKRVSADFKVELPIYHEYYFKYNLDDVPHDVYEIYEPTSITVTVKAKTKTYSTKTIDKSASINANYSGIEVNIPSNSLMQDDTLVETIRNNVLDDYEQGVATATLDVFCGTKIYYSSGDIISPNDVIQVDGDDGLWRVTGRTLNYEAAPTMSLELQKLRRIGWQDKNILETNPIVVEISDGSFEQEEVTFGNFAVEYTKSRRSVSAIVSAVYYDGTVISERIPFGTTRTLNGPFSLYRWCELEVTFDSNGITYSAESLMFGKKYYWKSLTLEKIVEFY